MCTNMNEKYNSDESDTDFPEEVKGYLNKWTNYIHGWQPRYIVLKDGTLSYYRSESESSLGCRGLINLNKATIKIHEFDECRFDVTLNNCVWYLRADTPQDKSHWIEILQSYKDKQEIYTKDTSTLKRHGSSVSLQSNSLSISSGCSLQKTQKGLKEKISEIETFKDILFNQIEILQRYFDACADINDNGKPLDLNDSKLNSLDFKGESITFKATATGVITTLQHCLDMIILRDECWTKELEKEREKRKALEKLNKQYKNEIEQLRNSSSIGPDMEEGPHSTLPEDEFFDAVESGLDKIEEDRQLKVKLKLLSQHSQISSNSSVNETQNNDSEEFGTGKSAKLHRLWSEIDKVCNEQLKYAREGVGQGGNGWQLFASEGEMKMYKREEEINGLVVDPLKACHVVKGVTSREMCHYFFMPEFRYDWETTLEDMVVLERISSDTLVFLQTHKRIWPASQRDAVFWSHMRKITDNLDPDAHDVWIVCNNSTEHSDYPAPNTGKCIRIFLTVILVCQTYVANGKKGENLTRDDLSCKITYCSIVNPGGWAPASVLRAVYKREYPKFLKRFTQYVIDQCKDKPIMF